VLRYLKAAVFAAGLFTVPAFSAILTQSGPLTLEQCVAMALESNLRIEIANEKITQQNLAVKEAATSQLPKLSAQAAYTRLHEATTVSGLAPLFPDPTTGVSTSVVPFELNLGANAYTAGVTLTQPIYTGGRITNAKQIAQYGLSASEWQHKSTVREIRRDVTTAYYNVLAARKSLVALDSAIAMMEVLTRDLSNAVDVGMRGEHELLQAQVQLLNQRLSRQQAASRANAAADFLSTLIGNPVNRPLNLVGEIDSPDGLNMPDVTVLQAQAREASADLKALEDQLSIVEASARIAGATYVPTVAAIASYSGQGTTFDRDAPGGWKNGASVSLVAQWEFFDGGAARQKKRQAHSQMRQVELGMENLKIMLDMQVKNNMTSLEDAFLSIETSRKNIEQSKRSYEISYDKFKEGVLLSSELLNAQNLTLQAEISYYAALSNFYARQAELDYLVNPDNR
jgi:outer membrane protein TolC